MTQADSAQRKPAASEGHHGNFLMAQLKILWSAVPNDVLRHWMSQEFPTNLRVMACVVRHSFGSETLCCVAKEDDPTSPPLQQTDIAKLLNLHKGSVAKAIRQLTLERLVHLEGRKIYAIAEPSKAPSPKILEMPSQPETPELRDPDYLQEIQEARVEYSRTMQQAKAVLQHQLEKARLHYQARQAALGKHFTSCDSGNFPPTEKLPILARKVAKIATSELPDSQPYHYLAQKDIHTKETSEWVGEELVVGSSSAPPPDATPTHPLPSQESKKAHPTTLEVYEYLKQFTPQIGKAPDVRISLNIHRHLRGASIQQLELLRQQRCQSGLAINSYGIFLNLADDVARSQEAFMTGAPTRPKSREEQQAEDYARRRRGERH